MEGRMERTTWQEMCHKIASPKKSNDSRGSARLQNEKNQGMTIESNIKVWKQR
jgi:hypothetical protein